MAGPLKKFRYFFAAFLRMIEIECATHKNPFLILPYNIYIIKIGWNSYELNYIYSFLIVLRLAIFRDLDNMYCLHQYKDDLYNVDNRQMRLFFIQVQKEV